MSFAISRHQKIKGTSNGWAIQQHNERIGRFADKENIDESRSHLNQELFKSPLDERTYNQQVSDRIAKAKEQNSKMRVRKDSVKLVETLFTSDNDFFKDKSDAEIKSWASDTLEFFKAEVGEENIHYFTIHLDEETPHIHCGWTPITTDNRLHFKSFYNGQTGLSMYQSRYHKFMKQKGWDLQRGMINSNRTHLTPDEMRTVGQENVDKFNKKIRSSIDNAEVKIDIDNLLKEFQETSAKLIRGKNHEKKLSDLRESILSEIITQAHESVVKGLKLGLQDELAFKEIKDYEKYLNYYVNKSSELDDQVHELINKNDKLDLELDSKDLEITLLRDRMSELEKEVESLKNEVSDSKDLESQVVKFAIKYRQGFYQIFEKDFESTRIQDFKETLHKGFLGLISEGSFKGALEFSKMDFNPKDYQFQLEHQQSRNHGLSI
jgi:regulator of replication initiation timing